MIQIIMAHLPMGIAVAVSVVSEAIALRQVLKYPDNDSFGGLLAGILKVLMSMQGKAPASHE